MDKLKCYCASGWFHEVDEKILTKLENYLRTKETVKPYFPRHDGIKLKAGEFHDPKLREKVFLDNVRNIDEADFIVANLDGRLGQDTGTVWEVGYAMANGIPVIAYQEDNEGKLKETMGAVSNGFFKVCIGLDELDAVIDMVPRIDVVAYAYPKKEEKVLFISPDNTEENISKSTDVANVLIECYGKNFKWIDKLSNTNIADKIEEVFSNVGYMVAVIDDRHPVVSWMMGQAYARKIPTISYTNYDWGVNLMLICSILSHVKGVSNLKEVIQSIKREGIESLGKFNNKDIKVF